MSLNIILFLLLFSLNSNVDCIFFQRDIFYFYNKCVLVILFSFPYVVYHNAIYVNFFDINFGDLCQPRNKLGISSLSNPLGVFLNSSCLFIFFCEIINFVS